MGWKKVRNHHLYKKFEFKDFKEAMRFLNQVAKISEEINHHPDISISYNKVTIKIFTHKIDGITKKDFELSEEIDKLK